MLVRDTSGVQSMGDGQMSNLFEVINHFLLGISYWEGKAPDPSISSD